ncbi:MAG: ketopantoate reductase family protein [Deltaproteobacteria bacterium]|nr:ketopantoate reductase family protein [Deltaproteobacteria bacterium]
MNIAIMGAGGLGAFYGIQLARAGNAVTFIARGATLAALRTQGLRVKSELLGDLHLPQVRATDIPAQAGPAELVLLTTKAYDLESAARSLTPLVNPDTTVLPLLNGVDIAERLGAVLGPDRILGGLCRVSAAIAEPGVITQAGKFSNVVFGELSGETTPRARAVLAAFEAAGIATELSPHIRRDIWTKYLFIAAASGVCALTSSTLGPVLNDPDTRALFTGVMTEIAALAARAGITLGDSVVANSLAAAQKMPPTMKPSMLHDLEQRKSLEVEALNGTAARLGRELGVPTPINQFIYAALKHRAAGATP